jgi:hypothetical protein
MNSGGSPRCGLLRLRPASAEALGPSPDELDRLIAVLWPEDSEQHHVPYNFPVSLDASPLDEGLVERLHGAMSQEIRDKETLLVDLSQKRSVELYSVLDWLLFRALLKLLPRLRSGQTITVFVDVLPQPGDKLYGLTSDLDPESYITFLDSHGVILGRQSTSSNMGRKDLLKDLLRRPNAGLPEIFASRLLRQRGVFRGTSQGETRYYRYRYVVTGKHAQTELVEILKDFFSECDVDGVIFSNAYRNDWLEPCVSAAAGLVGMAWSSLETLAMSREQVMPALHELWDRMHVLFAEENESRFCVIVPVFRDGRSLQSILRHVPEAARDRVVPLAVLMDDARVEVEGDDWFGTVTFPMGPRDMIVHYLHAVPMREVSADDWTVAAASILDEIVEADEVTSSDQTRIAFWTLFDEYPTGIEEPSRKGRDAVRWFPLLENLTHWDALWAANLLLERAIEFLNCDRSEILFVIPVEKNASLALRIALESRLGVAVVGVTRKTIDGETELPSRDRIRIQNYRAFKVIAVDESFIGGRTLSEISDIVMDCRGRGVDLRLALLGAGEPPSDPTQHACVYRWSPLLHVAGSDTHG